MHMYWECPDVYAFWRQISIALSNMLQINIPLSPSVRLRNDESTIKLSHQGRRVLWTAISAAKKMLALRWQLPRTLSQQQWINCF